MKGTSKQYSAKALFEILHFHIDFSIS